MVRRYTSPFRPLTSSWPQIGTPARAQHLLRTEFVSPFRSTTMPHVMSDEEPTFVVVHDGDEKEVILPRVEGRYVDDTKRQKKKILAKIEELRIWAQTGDEWSKRWLKNLEKDLEVLRNNKSRRYTIKQPLGQLFLEPNPDGEEKFKARNAREYAAGHRDNRNDRSWKSAGYKHAEEMRGAIYEHEKVVRSNGEPIKYSTESRHKNMTRRTVARDQWAINLEAPAHRSHSFNAMLWLGWQDEMSKIDMIAAEQEVENKMWAEIYEIEAWECVRLGEKYWDMIHVFVDHNHDVIDPCEEDPYDDLDEAA